jgi:hypothetical protein
VSLRRVQQQTLLRRLARGLNPGIETNPIFLRLLEGEFKPGDRIKVTANGEGLVFKVK